MTTNARLFALILSMCLAAVIAGCQSGEQSPLTLQARLEGRTLAVDWGASLPSNAELSLHVWHVTRLTLDVEDERFLVVRSLVLGSDNQRQAFDLADWPAGEVHATLTFHPLSQVDPDVIAAVGLSGERLAGPQVITPYLDDERYLEVAVVVLIP